MGYFTTYLLAKSLRGSSSKSSKGSSSSSRSNDSSDSDSDYYVEESQVNNAYSKMIRAIANNDYIAARKLLASEDLGEDCWGDDGDISPICFAVEAKNYKLLDLLMGYCYGGRSYQIERALNDAFMYNEIDVFKYLNENLNDKNIEYTITKAPMDYLIGSTYAGQNDSILDIIKYAAEKNLISTGWESLMNYLYNENNFDSIDYLVNLKPDEMKDEENYYDKSEIRTAKEAAMFTFAKNNDFERMDRLLNLNEYYSYDFKYKGSNCILNLKMLDFCLEHEQLQIDIRSILQENFKEISKDASNDYITKLILDYIDQNSRYSIWNDVEFNRDLCWKLIKDVDLKNLKILADNGLNITSTLGQIKYDLRTEFEDVTCKLLAKKQFETIDFLRQYGFRLIDGLPEGFLESVIENNGVRVLEQLVKLGVDLADTNEYNYYLDYAKDKEMMKFLVNQNVRITGYIRNKDIEEIKLLGKSGYLLDEKEVKDIIDLNREDILELFFDRQKEMFLNEIERTIIYNKYESFKFLQQYNNKTDKNKLLIMALKNNRTEIAKCLVKNGAVFNIKAKMTVKRDIYVDKKEKEKIIRMLKNEQDKVRPKKHLLKSLLRRRKKEEETK